QQPPRMKAKSVLPSDATYGRQTAEFCSQGILLVGDQTGSIYRHTYKLTDTKPAQVGRLASGDITYRVSTDRDTVFAFDSFRLLAGRCGESLHNITEHNSQINDLVDDDAGGIVLVAGRDLARIGRSFYVLGLPIWRMGWPAIRRQMQ